MCTDIYLDPPCQGREGPREAAQGGDGRQAREDQGCSRAQGREADRQADRHDGGSGGGEVRATRWQLTKHIFTSLLNEDMFGKGSCIRSNRLGRCSVHISLKSYRVFQRKQNLSHFTRGIRHVLMALKTGSMSCEQIFKDGFAFQTRLQQQCFSLVILYCFVSCRVPNHASVGIFRQPHITFRILVPDSRNT